MSQNNDNNILSTKEEFSFSDVTSVCQIRIPRIQRDYVQGRESKGVSEIRSQFVRSLLLVVKGLQPKAELDFVYGTYKDHGKVFEPLDGQQRLTTLYLLHWFLEDDAVTLQLADGRRISALTYATRTTSTEFCDEIIHHKATDYIKEFLSSDKKGTFSDVVKTKDWFKWSWKYDPTIRSMLTMLDEINAQMIEGPESLDNFNTYRANLGNIIFRFNDLDKLQQSDELYIKMNARGKVLSAFDKLKSTLEEEIQIQIAEATDEEERKLLADIEIQWRERMDGRWIDLFWQKYAKNEDGQVTLDGAKKAETSLRRLILRTIALQLLMQKRNGDIPYAAYNMNDDDLDWLLIEYGNMLAKWRASEEKITLPENLVKIDFKSVIEEIDSLILTSDNVTYSDVTSLLAEEENLDEDSHQSTYLDLIVGERVSNHLVAIWHAITEYQHLRPIATAPEGQKQAWIDDFHYWVKSIRNVLHSDNNNAAINKIYRLIERLNGVETLINNRFSDISIPIRKQWAAISDDNFNSLDRASMTEEIEKARLAEDGGWAKTIATAECHPYLWGQIRFLLDWAEGDLDKFTDYFDRFSRLYEYYCKVSSDGIYATMLAITPDYWEHTYSHQLYVFWNKNYLESMKRLLRNKPEDSSRSRFYANPLKRMIDRWREPETSKLDFEEFSTQILAEYIATDKKDWIWCLCQKPELIQHAWRRCIDVVDGHIVFPSGKTSDTAYSDPILFYIDSLLRELFAQQLQDESMDCTIVINNSRIDPVNSLKFSIYGHSIFIDWATDDGYRLDAKLMNLKKELTFIDSKDLLNSLSAIIIPELDDIVAKGGIDRAAIKSYYVDVPEEVIDALLDNKIEFSHEGENTLTDAFDNVMAEASLIIGNHKIAVSPVDESSADYFIKSGYKIISLEEFDTAFVESLQ